MYINTNLKNNSLPAFTKLNMLVKVIYTGQDEEKQNAFNCSLSSTLSKNSIETPKRT